MRQKKYNSSNPDPVDIHVGRRMRERRSLMGLSQEQLGKELGLTFQQIQKYERGINRMGSSRLYNVSQIIGVSVGWFFAGLPGETEATPSSENTQPITVDCDHLTKRETLELVRAYYRIEEGRSRRKIYELIQSMSAEFIK